MSKILVIEDEQKLAKFLELELQYEGYEVTLVLDGNQGLEVAQKNNPDLILLDWMLPQMSGFDVCRQLRSLGYLSPIILLTAQDDVSDRIASLDAGADDYLVKPFSIESLLSRLKIHLGHNSEQDPDELHFLDLTLNRRTREVKRGDRNIDLTATEYDLMEYLISHPRQVLTREQILEKVWGYDFSGDSNIIEVYVRYLRLKLESNKEKRIIQTIRGVGYVLKD